jgi:NAD(P)-dependent dehydrogenase (short-subunit alcohol dehydrogenase family)
VSRRVLVTGAASGLGAALAKAFAVRGDTVLATDRATDLATDPATDPSGPVLSLDVTSDDDWQAARAWVERHWGGLDVLVNNAGIAVGGRIDVCSMAEWERATSVNLLGVARGCHTFARMLKDQRSGRIVNIASLAGLVHPPSMAAYNAVKAGVVALSETLGHELAPYGVGCSVVCPSYFRTGIAAAMTGTDTETGAKIAQLVEASPLTADDIAAAVLDGIDAGTELIIPDDAARAAVALKSTHRAEYDAQMRATATRAMEREQATGGASRAESRADRPAERRS